MKKRMMILLITVTMLATMLTGCGKKEVEVTEEDVIEYIEEKLEGEYEEKEESVEEVIDPVSLVEWPLNGVDIQKMEEFAVQYYIDAKYDGHYEYDEIIRNSGTERVDRGIKEIFPIATIWQKWGNFNKNQFSNRVTVMIGEKRESDIYGDSIYITFVYADNITKKEDGTYNISFGEEDRINLNGGKPIIYDVNCGVSFDAWTLEHYLNSGFVPKEERALEIMEGCHNYLIEEVFHMGYSPLLFPVDDEAVLKDVVEGNLVNEVVVTGEYGELFETAIKTLYDKEVDEFIEYHNSKSSGTFQ